MDQLPGANHGQSGFQKDGEENGEESEKGGLNQLRHTACFNRGWGFKLRGPKKKKAVGTAVKRPYGLGEGGLRNKNGGDYI